MGVWHRAHIRRYKVVMTQDMNCATNLVQRDAYLSFLLPHRGLRQTFVVFDFPRFDVGLFFLPLIKFRNTVERQLCLLIGCLEQSGINIINLDGKLIRNDVTGHIKTR